MTDTLNEDKPGFVAEEPVHCFACVRPIRPGQTYYLTIEHEVLCADCALSEGMIPVREDLAVEVKRDPLPIQCGKAEVELAVRLRQTLGKLLPQILVHWHQPSKMPWIWKLAV